MARPISRRNAGGQNRRRDTGSFCWGCGNCRLGQRRLSVDLPRQRIGVPSSGKNASGISEKIRARCSVNRTVPSKPASEAGPAIAEAHSSRGCAFGDFENHGISGSRIGKSQRTPSSLAKRHEGLNHPAQKLKLIGTKSNRSAIGARVVVRYGKSLQGSGGPEPVELRLGERFCGCTSASALKRLLNISIRWPNGLKQQPKAVVADELIVVKEGSGIVRNQGWSKALPKSASTR